jgi:hypothetical protein
MDLRKARGDLLHHRWRLDRSILTDVDTLYCSFVASAAVRLPSPQLNSPIMYSCILQLHVTGTLLFHLARDIDMCHVSTIQIHSDVQLYSCTAVPCGDTATFRRQLPYPDTVLGHTKLYYHLVPSIGTVLDTYQGTAVRPAYSCMFVC